MMNTMTGITEEERTAELKEHLLTRMRNTEMKITDDLDALLAVLPPDIAQAVRDANRADELLEVVMDLGRRPEARYLTHEVALREREVTAEDLEYVIARVGDFGEDNRAGIERTLHRISAIRNRKGRIVGLTCRVGRAVYGTIDIIRDIVESGKSILLLGKPGVGKTTMLREVARVLAETKRVVIVDTSNEIGGDGDIPHPAIGRARRMQVATPAFQHEVMIEAVENHMPEVIIIDEIGRELEALAARTIAERGVQLVATAHGRTLDNLMMNPTLADLVGGIQSVTLSDEEARRRGTQKSVLERKAPPTFDVLIEIKDWQHLIIHHDVAKSVDAILRGQKVTTEVRYRDESGQIHAEITSHVPPLMEQQQGGRMSRGFERAIERGVERPAERPAERTPDQLSTLRVYGYGVGQNKILQAARALQVPAITVRDLSDADVVLTLKNYYRRRPQPLTEAEDRGIMVYVLRSNTVVQIQEALANIFGLNVTPVDDFAEAMAETESAIQQVLAGAKFVELSPQSAEVRREQHRMARQAHLLSESTGREPYRRVRIFRGDQA
jgi:stage III sporulation protein SpoIIIAA